MPLSPTAGLRQKTYLPLTRILRPSELRQTRYTQETEHLSLIDSDNPIPAAASASSGLFEGYPNGGRRQSDILMLELVSKGGHMSLN